jgi:EpsI family protein
MNELAHQERTQSTTLTRTAMPGARKIQLTVLGLVFLAVTFRGLFDLVGTWLNRDEYSHGFIVPFVSLYFVWLKREDLRRLAPEPSILGGTVMTGIGCLLFLAGHISGIAVAQELAVIVIIPGLVCLFLGMRYLKALALPLGYLIFMVPVLDIFLDNIHAPFQRFSAAGAEWLLKGMQVPVRRYDLLLVLPTIILKVANECSGIRFLISIIAVGIPVAFFAQKNNLRRLLLIVFAVFLGILINPLRIALIGLWAYHGGKVDHGPLHIFQGLFVAVMGFCFLFLGALWLNRKYPTQEQKDTGKPPLPGSDGEPFSIRRFQVAWFAAMALLIGLGASVYFYDSKPAASSRPLGDIPLVIGEWRGADVSRYQTALKLQNADSEIVRVYRNASGRAFVLSLGYYAVQNRDKVLVDGGLLKAAEHTGTIVLNRGPAGKVRVNTAVLNDEDKYTLVLYWYEVNGRTAAGRYEVRLATALEGLFHRRTNGAIIAVSCDLDDPDGKRTALTDAKEFIVELLPVLRRQFS